MKTKLIHVLFVVLFAALVGCAPEDTAPEVPIDDNFDPTTATFIKGGTIVGIGHTASGMASIYLSNKTHVVLLDPYESQNGPDLKIYLSKDQAASQYVNLGQLKSTMGKQTYVVPSSVNVNDYPYVLVWCEKFSVIFAAAEMK